MKVRRLRSWVPSSPRYAHAVRGGIALLVTLSVLFIAHVDYHRGYADVLAFYNKGGARTKAWLFRGTSSGISPPTMVWDSGPGSWDWRRSKAVYADFNHDSYVDALVFYNNGSSRTKAW